MTDFIPMMPGYEEYKNSGVAWIGEMPRHWHQLPLCTIAQINSVTNCQNEELLSVYLELGVIKFSEIEAKRTNATSKDLSKYQFVSPGDFILNNQQAWRGSVGVSKYLGIVSPAYLVLKLSSKFNSNYANYLFRNGAMVSQYLISSKGVGTIQRNLYWPQLRRSIVCFPEISEQIIITNFLDCKTAKIDQAVAIKEKQIQLLKERKQILIQTAVTKGLDPDVPMHDSGVEWIGEIPEHWQVKRLKYITLIFRGKFTHRPRNDESLYNGKYPFFQTGDVARAGKFLFQYKQTLNEKGLRVSTLIPKGTVVITIAANIGDVSILNIDACFPDSIVGFKPIKNLDRDFLFYALSSMKEQFVGSTIKNTQMNLNVNRIGSNFITYPPLKEQDQIVTHIQIQSDKIDKAIAIQEQMIDKLKEYKATLINSAVTGKIKVPQIGETKAVA